MAQSLFVELQVCLHDILKEPKLRGITSFKFNSLEILTKILEKSNLLWGKSRFHQFRA